MLAESHDGGACRRGKLKSKLGRHGVSLAAAAAANNNNDDDDGDNDDTGARRTGAARNRGGRGGPAPTPAAWQDDEAGRPGQNGTAGRSGK
jgi:hypothetical protein